MVINLSTDEPCQGDWSGGEINIYFNFQLINTIQSSFTEHKYCQPLNQINLTSDIFQLQSTDSYGFCVENLSVNEKQLLGSNSTQNNCGHIGMFTSELKIRDDKIIYFECKGLKNQN